MSLQLKPITLAEANAFVGELHRHHGRAQGHKFSIGAVDGHGLLVGTVITGRPVARAADDGWTAEVTRLTTNGARNACSLLYGAAARAAKAMGYKKIQTYIFASEDGASLRASGWVHVADVRGRSWDCKSRPREDKCPTEDKQRWERSLRNGA